MIVLVLMAPLLATTLSETLNCKAGSFSLGETASVTCYFHEDVGKSLHHFYVSFSPFDSRNEVTDTEVLVCFNQRGESYSCRSARGYHWDNVISSTLTIEIPDVQTRFAGHYSCHLAPLGDLQIKPCDLHVEDGNGPSLDLSVILLLGVVSGTVLIASIALVAVHCQRKRLNKKGRSEQPSPKTGIEISTLQQVEETNDSGTEMPTRRQLKETFDPGTEMSTLQQHAETSDPVEESLLNKTMEQTLEEMEMPTLQQHAETSDSGTEMPTLQKHAETTDPAPLLMFRKSVNETLEAISKEVETLRKSLEEAESRHWRLPEKDTSDIEMRIRRTPQKTPSFLASQRSARTPQAVEIPLNMLNV